MESARVDRWLWSVRLATARTDAVGAPTCFLVRTPKPAPVQSVPVAVRGQRPGRPTKRDRRMMEKLRGTRR